MSVFEPDTVHYELTRYDPGVKKIFIEYYECFYEINADENGMK